MGRAYVLNILGKKASGMLTLLFTILIVLSMTNFYNRFLAKMGISVYRNDCSFSADICEKGAKAAFGSNFKQVRLFWV